MKRTISLLVCLIMLLSATSIVFAAPETEQRVISCDYYSDGQHRHEYYETTYENGVYSGTHMHAVDDGYGGTIYLECDIYKDYSIKRYVCKCGHETRIRQATNTYHIHQ